MILKYNVVFLFIDIITSAVMMSFLNKKLRNQFSIQYKLEQTKAELLNYRQYMTNNFVQNTKLLDDISLNYNQLYKYITKRSNSISSLTMNEKKILINSQKQNKVMKNQQCKLPVIIQKKYFNLIYGAHKQKNFMTMLNH